MHLSCKLRRSRRSKPRGSATNSIRFFGFFHAIAQEYLKVVLALANAENIMVLTKVSTTINADFCYLTKMKSPLYLRQQIPFFYDKSEKEIQQDPYERFDPMVVRQSVLHLADELWGTYFMEAIFQFAKPYISDTAEEASFVELGCGVGRWIASLAKAFPSANCWGIDYSYQMLKRADEVWIQNHSIHMNLSQYGFPNNYELKAQESISNLKFALAKASNLPFDDKSQDLVLSSFLLDRLEDPIEGLKEMRRILKPGGRMILITPLNFRKAKHWERFYPAIKIHQIILQLGFEILDWQENLIIEEPLDIHGNVVRWNCIGLVGQGV